MSAAAVGYVSMGSSPGSAIGNVSMRYRLCQYAEQAMSVCGIGYVSTRHRSSFWYQHRDVSSEKRRYRCAD
eukprot:1926269-Rhodomonas_salina.1